MSHSCRKLGLRALWLGAVLAAMPGLVRAQASGVRFRNTNSITINDAAPATPYPSTINVSGLPGVVSKVTVTLSNLTHSFPDDIDVLLVSPAGRAVVLMSDAGGGADLNNVTLVFDDSAALRPPDATLIVSGSYKPSNYAGNNEPDTFLPPAPADPSGTTLSAFNGASANGVWSLYILDDAGGDSGLLAQGWSLRFNTVDPLSAADLALTLIGSDDPVQAGRKLIYTLTLTNFGPSTATNVVLTDVLPDTVDFSFASASIGICGFDSGTLICNFGDLAVGEGDVVTLVVFPNTSGVLTNSASLALSGNDFNIDNSSASILTTVTPADVADLALTMTDAPDPVILGQNITYTILVTNKGPLGATGVTLTDLLPPNVTLLGSGSSQGSCGQAGGSVICALGSLTNGGSALVTLTVRADLLGVANNRASVVANEVDLTPSTASTTTLIFLPSDVSVSQRDSADPASLGSNLTYTVSVLNRGPGLATGVILSNTLPVNATFVSAVTTQGSCVTDTNRGLVTCNLGTLSPLTGVTVAFTVRPMLLGAYVNTARVTANEVDPNLANNVSVENTRAFPGGNGIIITPTTNALELANVVTAAGGTGIRVTRTALEAHSQGGFTNFFGVFVPGATSSGLFSVLNPPYTYGLTGQLGVVISSGSVLDYQTGQNTSPSRTTGYNVKATTNQQALLAPITMSSGRTFDHFDVTQLDIEFDLLPGFDSVKFDVVFGSEEYPEFVNSSFVDGFGIYLNGVNIAFTQGRPVNINHPSMVAFGGTELDGVLAPNGKPIVTFSKFIGSGVTNNRLIFIVSDTSDSVLDTTVFVSSLQGALPPNADLSASLAASAGLTTVGSNLTYTILVTNNGPDTATDVRLTNALPANFNILAAVPSQGSCSLAGDVVICDLFQIPSGGFATITIAGTPGAEGRLTNGISVGAAQVDFVPTNNAAVLVTSAIDFGAFINAGAITINDAAPAAPYPASITVSGFSGVITQMTVTLVGLSHTFPQDIDVLLVGPGGQSVILMSDAGRNFPLNGVTLTFDDRVTPSLPQGSPITTGVYRPTNYDSPDFFLPPAPPGPYGSSLSVFNGTDPDGTWSLYIVDDLGKDAGVLVGGWRLSFGLEPSPALRIQMAGTNVVISWPAPSTGYVLESNGDVAAASGWAPAGLLLNVGNGRNTVMAGASNAARFYRLSKTSP